MPGSLPGSQPERYSPCRWGLVCASLSRTFRGYAGMPMWDCWLLCVSIWPSRPCWEEPAPSNLQGSLLRRCFGYLVGSWGLGWQPELSVLPKNGVGSPGPLREAKPVTIAGASCRTMARPGTPREHFVRCPGTWHRGCQSSLPLCLPTSARRCH